MIVLTPQRAARMLTLWSARRILKRPDRPVLWRALYGLAAQRRLGPKEGKVGRWV